MRFVTGLRCVICGARHTTRVPYTCPRCGVTRTALYAYFAAVAYKLLRISGLAVAPG